MGYIEGQDRNQMILFPESIEDYVSVDNVVRVIEAYVEQADLEEMGFTKTTPASTGRPPFSAKTLVKLYIYGYSNQIRSSRKLNRETKRNLEVMWLLKKLSPDHRVIADFRSENAKPLKVLFRSFVKMCNEFGLYGKELSAIDGSKFEAVNPNDRNFNDKKLEERIARLDAKIEEYMKSLDEVDKQEEISATENKGKTADIIEEMKRRKAIYEEYRQRLSETGDSQISQTDPDSRRMQSNGRADVCYNVQHVIDSKHKMVVDFEVTNQANDVNQLSKMTQNSADILEVESITSISDKGYDNATEIAKCIMAGHQPHVIGTDFDICIPIAEAEQGQPSACIEITEHHNGRCIYLEDRNIAICPMGQILYPSSYKKSKGIALFRNGRACSACKCKCTEGKYKVFEIRMPKSKFTKEYTTEGLSIKQVRIKADGELCKLRKSLAEHPFGTIKRSMGAGYLLTKGLGKVIGEISLTYLSYNLKRAINILGVKEFIDAIKNRKKRGRLTSCRLLFAA